MSQDRMIPRDRDFDDDLENFDLPEEPGSSDDDFFDDLNIVLADE